MGSLLLADLTEDRAKRYISVRKQEGAGNRTINMELGELTRAIATTWKTLWPKLKKMDEPKDIGRALSSEEETCLLEGGEQEPIPIHRDSHPHRSANWNEARRNHQSDLGANRLREADRWSWEGENSSRDGTTNSDE